MPDPHDHLSEIKTLWSVVHRAHGDTGPEVRSAQERMLAIYGGAVRRYLMAALRNEDGADEVYQEFSLRFVRGDFRNVNPERGKFRSFLKTCLYHLIVDHQRRRKSREQAGGDVEQLAVAAAHDDDAATDAAFLKSWRDDLLARAWQQLADDEQATGKPYHSVLKTRAERPELSSTELAEAVTSQLGREITSANVRVLVHRARELFADCLLSAVVDSLPESRRDLIEEELIELQLLDYCRAALERSADK
ncbi:MAG TPA: sigma-70 family RNA polymerase sigma factor [Planctomycetaceae bacterium]|nr:sigma-70 family RNA polymerase sigma factor [Planctomycetaceae bacterium]